MSTSTSSEAPPAGGPDAETTEPTDDADTSQKWFARHRALSDKQEVWDRAQKSFRFAPRPYRWREVGLGLLVLYGGFIGLPAALGAWAVYEIARRMGHGG